MCVRAPVRECSDHARSLIVHAATLDTSAGSVTLARWKHTHTHKSGSAVSDAGAIPMLWRWFAFVWFTGIGVTGGGGGRKNVAGCSPTLRSQCQGEVISLMVAGVLLGLRAAAALRCLLHAAIVPHPRACVRSYVGH